MSEPSALSFAIVETLTTDIRTLATALVGSPFHGEVNDLLWNCARELENLLDNV